MYPRKKLALGRLRGKIRAKAQASLEMAIAIVSVLLLLLGCLRVFFWVNQRFVLRQEAYESMAVEAANTAPNPIWETERQQEMQVDDSALPKLDLEILSK
ncbi:MAG: hypothetical protein NT066_05905 [Candidatus Omnitrophica bacterium]|nr:hypothetical protein [Candidatus Omnitrophota bacterium]